MASTRSRAAKPPALTNEDREWLIGLIESFDRTAHDRLIRNLDRGDERKVTSIKRVRYQRVAAALRAGRDPNYDTGTWKPDYYMQEGAA
jgi:hypothetical protein